MKRRPLLEGAIWLLVFLTLLAAAFTASGIRRDVDRPTPIATLSPATATPALEPGWWQALPTPIP